MSEPLTVPTHFGDISELSEGLVDRVDHGRIILYGPTSYPEGETVGFAVLLLDGTAALEGTGRVAAAVDGGEERAPETRWDIVFDSLELDGRSEVVYERIVLARQSSYGLEAEDAGESSLAAEVEVAESVPPAENLPPAESLPPEELAADAEMARESVELEPLEDAPSVGLEAAPVVEEEPSPEWLSDGVLGRPMHPPAWRPAPEPVRPPGPSTGAFAHPQGPLPIPDAPPRPELGPGEAITPAPRPGEDVPTPSLLDGLAPTGEPSTLRPTGEPVAEEPPIEEAPITEPPEPDGAATPDAPAEAVGAVDEVDLEDWD